MWGVPDFIRWRPDSMGGGTDSGALTRQSTVFMTNPEGAPVNCPPSVSAFMRSMSIKGSSLARSESVISKSSFGYGLPLLFVHFPFLSGPNGDLSPIPPPQVSS